MISSNFPPTSSTPQPSIPSDENLKAKIDRLAAIGEELQKSGQEFNFYRHLADEAKNIPRLAPEMKITLDQKLDDALLKLERSLLELQRKATRSHRRHVGTLPYLKTSGKESHPLIRIQQQTRSHRRCDAINRSNS